MMNPVPAIVRLTAIVISLVAVFGLLGSAAS